MTTELPKLLRRLPASAAIDDFILFECTNLDTDCEHQYLATNIAQTFLLTFGEYLLGFDFELPADAQRWLSEDYAATADDFTLQLANLRDFIHRTYDGGAIFGFVKYNEDMSVHSFELSLRDQETADCGPEYVRDKSGEYQRWFRQSDLYMGITLAERDLLELCCPAFEALGKRFRRCMIAPPTPRYRDPGTAAAEAAP